VIGEDVGAVRLEGPYAGRLRWYRSLLHALAGARPPAGAVFEAAGEAPIPTVVVRPARLLVALADAPAAGSVRLARVPVPPALEPPVPGPGRIGLLRPDPDPEPGPRGPEAVPAELPSLHPLLDAGAWMGVQTFWVLRRTGSVDVSCRFRVCARDRATRDRAADVLGARLVGDWRLATRTTTELAWPRLSPVRDWRRAELRSFPPGSWWPAAEEGHRTAELGLGELQPLARSGSAHTVVFGASGSGKTTLLAARAARAIAHGAPTVVLDLHGDLAPQVVARLSADRRPCVVAVDAGERPVPGLAGLVAAAGSVDRAAAHFVAAVKRLSPDGTELAWGFRLERIFDTFARLVLESGGTLVDLYALLTDPDRRDAARLATRRPVVARFLDELGPILRRDPEFLWSAATRLSKVVLVPSLLELLAPRDGGLDVEGLLAEGRAVLVRLPLSTLGPESATFAGTLLLARIYLGLTARASGRERPVLLVLDEVHAFSPRLVAEILGEGRKFGVEVIAATQYPARLADEVRAAAAGAAGAFVAFRTPPASAGSVGPWIGLDPATAALALPGLPVGVALAHDPERAGVLPLPAERPPDGDPGPAWGLALAATRRAFGLTAEDPESVGDDLATERLLLALLAAEESGRPLAEPEVVGAASRLPGAPLPGEHLERAWSLLARGPEVERGPGGLRLSRSGERRLGLGRATGAATESSEHRQLLLRAFRLFARRGYRIEIVRQGRFDTTLPDAVYRQLEPPAGPESPGELFARLERARREWAWRFFGGRDVHVEAEVSGALRAERIRRGCAKAFAHDAFPLFVVGDAARARRVRSVLRSLGLRPDRAQVWTLRPPGELPNP
jgi:Helicase HerA, central domain